MTTWFGVRLKTQVRTTYVPGASCWLHFTFNTEPVERRKSNNSALLMSTAVIHPFRSYATTTTTYYFAKKKSSKKNVRKIRRKNSSGSSSSSNNNDKNNNFKWGQKWKKWLHGTIQVGNLICLLAICEIYLEYKLEEKSGKQNLWNRQQTV